MNAETIVKVEGLTKEYDNKAVDENLWRREEIRLQKHFQAV